jgi:hypothetical protein
LEYLHARSNCIEIDQFIKKSVTMSYQYFINIMIIIYHPLTGLRHRRVKATPRRPLPRVRVLHGRILPHSSHRDQLQGQRVLGQGKTYFITFLLYYSRYCRAKKYCFLPDVRARKLYKTCSNWNSWLLDGNNLFSGLPKARELSTNL